MTNTTTQTMDHLSCRHIAKIIISVVLCLEIYVSFFDGNATAIALPAMAGGLGIPLFQASWLLSAPSAIHATAMAMTGWLSKGVNEEQIFYVMTAVFGFASVMVGLSSEFTTALIFRCIQGSVNGMHAPIIQTMLLRLWGRENQKSIFAILSSCALLGMVMGPLGGGLITDASSWRWIYLINGPLAFFSCLIVKGLWTLPPTPKQPTKLFLPSLLLLLGWIMLFQVALNQGHIWDWWQSPAFRASVFLATILFAIFIFINRDERKNVLDFTVIKKKTCLLSLVLSTATTFLTVGPFLVLMLWQQKDLGYSPTMAGLTVVPLSLASVIAAPFAPYAIKRFGHLITIGLGCCALASSCYLLSHLTSLADFFFLAATRLMAGIGISVTVIACMDLDIAEIKEKDIASATGLLHFFRQLMGNAWSVALFMTMWSRFTITNRQHLVSELIPARNVVATALHKLGEFAPLKAVDWMVLDNKAAIQASTLGVISIFSFAYKAYLLLAAIAFALHYAGVLKKEELTQHQCVTE